MFHDPKNLSTCRRHQKGVPDIQHLSYGFLFSFFSLFQVFCYLPMEFLLLSSCCSSVHDALGKTRWHLLPACLLTFGYVEERGVCMLLRKAAFARLVLAMRID